MKKVLFFLIVCAGTASADKKVERLGTETYRVADSTLVTKDCTVTADGSLTATVVRERGKSWIVFLDREGEEEAQCEVRFRVSRPRGRVMVAAISGARQ